MLYFLPTHSLTEIRTLDDPEMALAAKGACGYFVREQIVS